MSKLITADYDGMQVAFTDAAWFNATDIAERYGKRPTDWLRLPETIRYLDALCRKFEVKKSHFVKTQRGGNVAAQGTWLHPKLGVRFAQWLDIDFAIWCDEQIDGLIRGTHPHYDWKRVRHEATASYKVMSQILLESRYQDGKTTAPHHFSNEARLVNWALTGEFKSINREELSHDELDLLARLEERNSVLIGRGMAYDARKTALDLYVKDWHEAKQALVRITAKQVESLAS